MWSELIVTESTEYYVQLLAESKLWSQSKICPYLYCHFSEALLCRSMTMCLMNKKRWRYSCPLGEGFFGYHGDASIEIKIIYYLNQSVEFWISHLSMSVLYARLTPRVLYLPGQVTFLLQGSDSLISPSQGAPSHEGWGPLQLLCLIFTPVSPQVVVHSPNTVHGVHLPSTNQTFP